MYDHLYLGEGLEPCPINVVRENQDEFANFKYAKCNVVGPGTPTLNFEDEFDGCHCSGKCLENCPCLTRFGPTYAQDGHILETVISSNTTKPIYECNKNCKCARHCTNRVVQFGVQTKLEVFRTGPKGMGLKTAEDIHKFKFVCEYAGEILTREEAKQRTVVIDSTDIMNYVLVLKEFLPNGETILTYVDPSSIGNAGRFINHSCAPNLLMLPVRVDNNVPKLCLFAARYIYAGEELTFDYSGEFRLNNENISYEHTDADNKTDTECGALSKRKPCLCGAASCKGFLPYDSKLYEQLL